MRGDITLYARYIDNLDMEYTVSFDVGNGVAGIDPVTTKGGRLFDLPTPVKAGSEFAGWYVSQFYSADKLSYRYEAEMPIEENLTLYAVWKDGNPIVDVNADGITVSGLSLNTRYTVSILKPNGSADEGAGTAANYAYDFASKEAGEYVITVTAADKTTTLHYNNKALSRVSLFKVTDTVMQFAPVSNVEHYVLTVTCGIKGHNHTDIDLETSCTWNFANCDMAEDGIKFTVKAIADGFVPSQSETYTFSRSLDQVAGLTVDASSELVTWNAVTNAKTYFVTVKEGNSEVYAANIGNKTSFSLKTFGEGNYTISVKGVARNWLSGVAAEATYNKTRLATPGNVTLNGNTLSWEAVEGATGYVVSVGGTEFTVDAADTTTYTIDPSALGAETNISVRAKGTDKADSLASDEIMLRAQLSNVRYEKGLLVWDPVSGVSGYNVKVNDGKAVQVTDNKYKVTLDREGENTIVVTALGESGAEISSETVKVNAYKITLDLDKQGSTAPAPVYRADGDPLDLPTPTYFGYTFEAWYNAAGGYNGQGTRYEDQTFGESQNITLYAGWTANIHTVTFNVGAYGHMETTKMEVRFGERTTLPVPESMQNEFAFSGWHRSNDAGLQVTDYTGNMTSAFVFDEDLTLYASYVEVFTFSQDKETSGLVAGKGPALIGNMVTEITVPATHDGRVVTRIADLSSCDKLQVINIPDTIQLITLGTTGMVFENDTALRAINVYPSYRLEAADGNYESYDGALIYNNPGTGEKELRYFPVAKTGDFTIPEGVTVIPSGAFNKVTALEKLYISYTVAQIQKDAFKTCSTLQYIEFLPTPEGSKATSLEFREGVFTSCAALTEIKLPARLDSFATDTFSALTNLANIGIEEGGKYTVIDGMLATPYVAEGYTGKDVEIVYAPKGKDLGVYTIPVGVVSIGEKAFFEHPKLTGIIIPGFVENIGRQAFGHITNLESIEFTGEAADPSLSIQPLAFYAGYVGSAGTWLGSNSKVTELTLPGNLVYLGQFSFGYYTKITEVYVETNRQEITFEDFAFVGLTGKDLTPGNYMYVTTVHIGQYCPAFSFPGVFGNKLVTVDVASGNPFIESDNEGVVYSAGKTQLLFYPTEKAGAYTIPSTVTEIAPSTFASRVNLTEIHIPSSVTTIGENAFNGCNKLTTVEFMAPAAGEEAQPLTIEMRAFYNCTLLSSVTLPERLTKLGTTVFYNCDGLVSIHLPKNLETIDQMVNSSYMGGGTYLDLFDQCGALKEITVDSANEFFSAKDGVLYANKKMKLSADGAEQYLPYEALYTSPGAEGTINVPGTVRIVRTYAFRGIPKVQALKFDDLVPIYVESQGESGLTFALDKSPLTFQQYAIYGSYTDENGKSRYNETTTEIKFPSGIETLSNKTLYYMYGLAKVTVPNTVTLIEGGAFYGCKYITQIEFEEGGEKGLVFGDAIMESAGSEGTYYYSAFGYYYNGYGTTNDMFKLTEITLPARTTRIGNYSFYHSPVESIKFAEGIKDLEIGKYAFAYVLSGTSRESTLEIPEGVKKIEDDAFYYAHLKEYKLPSTLVELGASVFYSTTFDIIPETIVVPAKVTKLGNYALTSSYGTKFTFKTIDLTQATGLTEIGNYAFYNLPQLEEVKFAPATDSSPNLTLGNYVFSADSMLSKVTIPANVTSMGTYVFNLCTSLEGIKFETFASGDNAGKSKLASIGTYAFTKSALRTLDFPESTATKLELGASLFAYCNALKTVKISASVQSIDNVFKACASLESIIVAEGSEYFKADAELPIIYDNEGHVVQYIYQALNNDFTVAAGSTRIGASAFYGQADLKNLYIPASVMEIGDSAFENCVSLENVVFGEGSVLTSIGNSAFKSCFNLKSINLEACTHLELLGQDVFYNDESLTGKLTLPATLTTLSTKALEYSYLSEIDMSACTKIEKLEDSVFAYNDNLKKVTLPDSITFLGKFTFRSCDGIEEIDLSNLTKLVHIGDKVGEAQTSTTGLFTFDCDMLTTVKFPESLKSIGTSVFNGAAALEAVYIGSGAKNDLSSLTSIAKYAFTKCLALQEVKLNGGTIFGLNIFEGDTALKKVEFVDGANLTKIQDATFKGCTALDTLNFTDLTGLSCIGDTAFSGCAFTEIDLSKCKGQVPSTAKDMFLGSGSTNDEIFLDCVNLASIKLPANVNTIGNSVFKNTGFTILDLEDFKQITTWGTYAFRGCLKLQTVKINKDFAKGKTSGSATGVGTYMFQDCTALKTIEFVKDYTSGILTNSMFKNCSELTDIKFNGAKIKTIGTNVFQGCTALTTVDMSSFTATALGNYMFQGCSSLTDVTLPKSITHTGTYTFQNCTELQSIDFSQTKITRFSTSATANVTATTSSYIFDGCVKLKEVVVPAGFVQIGGYAFQGCAALTEFDLSKIVKIGKQAFMNSGLTGTVTLSGSLDILGDYAFRGCTGITEFVGAAAGGVFQTKSGMIVKVENGSVMAVPGSLEVEGDTLTLPEGSALYAYMFEGFNVPAVKKLDLSNLTIESVPNYTFNASPFEQIILPETVTTIGTYVFQDSANLTSVQLPKGLTEIGVHAFDGCVKLASIELPATLEELPNYMFVNTGFTEFNIPETVKTLGENLFQNCVKLTSVTFPENIDIIPDYMFDGSGITQFTIPAHIKTVGFHAFSLSKLQSIVIPETVEKLGQYAFAESEVASAKFESDPDIIDGSGETPSIINAYTFSKCLNLREIDFGPRKTLYANEFNGSGLVDVTVPATIINNSGGYIFANSPNLKHVKFEGDPFATNTSNYNFSKCPVLESVELPETLQALGSYTFQDCPMLSSVNIPESLTTINASAFKNCTSLSGDIVLPESLATLNASAFSGCTSINSILLSASVGTINANVFENWTENQEIRFRDSHFAVCASCGVSWSSGLAAKVVYNYTPATVAD